MAKVPTIELMGLPEGREGQYTIETLGRDIRRGNQEFRSEFDALGIDANTPFNIRREGNDNVSSAASAGASISAATAGLPSRVPTINEFQTPDGTYRRDGDKMVFIEDPARKATRLRRQGAIDTLETQLVEGVGDERAAQIESRGELLNRKLFDRAERNVRQVLKGRGLDGSALDDATINVALEASERAELLVEDLFFRDQQATMSAINLLQSGGSVEAARSLQVAQLGQGAIQGTDALNAEIALGNVNARLGAQQLRLGHELSLANLDLTQQQIFNQQNQAELDRRFQQRQQDRAFTSSLLTTAAGIAGTLLAPATGGASLALGPLASGAAGAGAGNIGNYGSGLNTRLDQGLGFNSQNFFNLS